MKRPAEAPPRSLGLIHRDEVLPLREAARRMGWANKMIRTGESITVILSTAKDLRAMEPDPSLRSG